MQNCEVGDSVGFDLGNPISALWGSELFLSNSKGHYNPEENKLIVYTDSATTSFKVEYDYVAWAGLLNQNNRVSIFDNYGYEKYLPVCLDKDFEIKSLVFEAETQKGYSVEMPVDPHQPNFDLRYLSLICMNDSMPPQTCAKSSWNIRLFNTTLSDDETKRLDFKLRGFYDFVNERLWKIEEPKIIEMDYVGNTTYGSYLIVCPQDFKSLVLFHELMHLWCPSKLYVENSNGYYILSETLNEYLMNVYYSQLFGADVLQMVIDNKIELWNKHGKDSNGSLASQSNYVLSNHYLITCYGFLCFYEFAQKVGTDNFIAFLESFLKDAQNKPMTYGDFKQSMAKRFGEASVSFIDSLETSFPSEEIVH